MGVNFSELFENGDPIDSKSASSLLKALKTNNLDGFDYLEFKQSLRALLHMNMDIGTALKSAFATASTMGVTKEKLVKSADFYRGILSKEKQQFDSALQRQIQQKVVSKKEETESFKEKIGLHEKKIEQLKKEMEAMQQQIDNADQIIQEEKSKLEAINTNFESTFNSIVAQIDQDVKNINNFI